MRNVPVTRRAPLLVLSLLFAACGGGDDDVSQAPATVDEAIRQANDMVADRAAGGTEPMKAEDLQARLPEELGGMTRGETERQDMGTMGIKMSMAKATYSSGTRRIDVTLTDTGTMGAMAPMAAAWTMVDFDRTTSSGYERTIRHEGYKGYEELSNSGGRLRTEVSLLVGDRIVVQLKGVEVPMDELKDALDKLNLRSLANAK